MINRLVSIAPMMDCTDRHYRMLMRQMTRQTLLYTEMVTTGAVIHGDRDFLIAFNEVEHPIALQLGGSNPKDLAQCARIAQTFGYDEVNLNVGCPSNRVQSGHFGACLMKQPELVAEAVAEMQAAVSIPVTVKTRIGVDDRDTYEDLQGFIRTVSAAGCNVFIIHARKAWLQGLSPRQNREIPPLRYDRVYQLKEDFPALEIIINGGIQSLDDIQTQLSRVDGAMIGRVAYANPYLLASIDCEFFEGEADIPSRKTVLWRYLPYVASQLSQGVPLRRLTRHLIGLFQGQPGARRWRRYLSEHGSCNEQGIGVIETAMEFVI